MKRLFFPFVATLGLAACGAEPVWALDEALAVARHEHHGPTAVTIYTVLSTRSGAFDPAGTWRHPRLPERNDVHFGITAKMVDFHIDYPRARNTRRRRTDGGSFT